MTVMAGSVKLAGNYINSLKRQVTYLHLGIGPSRNLDDHVQDGLLFIGIQGDVVKWGNRDSILFKVDAVLQSVRSSDLAGGILGSHVCVDSRSGIGRRRRAREVSSYLVCARRNFVCIIGWRQCGRERERERLQIMG